MNAFDWTANFTANSSGEFVLRQPSGTKVEHYPEGRLANQPEHIGNLRGGGNED
jgi:hypothetical protein